MKIIETKPDMFCILGLMEWNIVMDDYQMDENHLVSDNNCNIVNLLCSFKKNKEW